MGRGTSKAAGGSAKGGGGGTSPRDKEELKEELIILVDNRSKWLEKNMDDDGMIDPSKVDEFEKMNKQIDNVEYDLFSQMSPTLKAEKFNKSNLTDLTSEEAAVARTDLMKDKAVYMAVKSAEHGTGFVEGGTTQNTAIDALYEKNPKKVYSTFNDTRKMLKSKYGDEITLYRAGTSQTAKATQNMTTTRKNAQQYADIYGTKVEKVKVPVKDVLCVNISRSGGYEEVLVLNKKKK